ncbi:DUF1127 domain-containing protein [Marinobacter halodurans]|uniref:DUF1127 domain-containing protein n=1 Tax=Marinobacter halodurans TaxID=2528979 RepID=A0ABY1ZEB6_9GAMM|nr:DUF1127 domain-containing protein [Marinobacter halodurans]TBW48234.1 DUF1127 domain-containing protein [Marinobacter halodurans]
MKKAMGFYSKWKKKRDFAFMVSRMDDRLLKDVGYSREQAEFRLSQPFWKFD